MNLKLHISKRMDFISRELSNNIVPILASNKERNSILTHFVVYWINLTKDMHMTIIKLLVLIVIF